MTLDFRLNYRLEFEGCQIDPIACYNQSPYPFFQIFDLIINYSMWFSLIWKLFQLKNSKFQHKRSNILCTILFAELKNLHCWKFEAIFNHNISDDRSKIYFIFLLSLGIKLLMVAIIIIDYWNPSTVTFLFRNIMRSVLCICGMFGSNRPDRSVEEIWSNGWSAFIRVRKLMICCHSSILC